jgi:predicted metal-dependent enzyme (double-stranded beta helix superfamily)
MPTGVLQDFIADCRRAAADCPQPADCVLAIAPLMHQLLKKADGFLKPEHLRADPAHYARNAIFIPEDRSLSLFALVWNPGQWTPIHDHGSWGVVGVLRGVLEERNYIRTDPGGHEDARDDGIVLERGGVILLDEGTVTSFVPNPDHIHVTGVPPNRHQVVSLHLYGREMDSFHIYNVAEHTRKRVYVAYNES